jgi:hypothetical protein
MSEQAIGRLIIEIKNKFNDRIRNGTELVLMEISALNSSVRYGSKHFLFVIECFK